MTIKNNLKEIRMKEFLMNQREFAEMLELNYRQYNRYENGTMPSLEVALRIAKKLNKKVEDIFTLDE